MEVGAGNRPQTACGTSGMGTSRIQRLWSAPTNVSSMGIQSESARDQAIGVYSTDAGESFQQIVNFRRAVCIHPFHQWDPFAKCLWMGTGDRDAECRMLTSVDGGLTWQPVGEDSQSWRAIGAAFTPEAVYWGMDAGFDAGDTPNHIMRWDRRTREAEAIQEIQGPCYGIAKLADGTILLATGVEGGQNERDRQSHLWCGSDRDFREIAAWDKDIWPAVVQIGTVYFPHGLDNSRKPCLVLLGSEGPGRDHVDAGWPCHA